MMIWRLLIMDYNNEEDYDAYLPKRSDTIYQEIESFEEYELTQCVAYEMAIRNEIVIDLKNIINKLLEKIKNNYIDCRDNNNNYKDFNQAYDLLEDEYDEKYYDDEYDNDELEMPDYQNIF